MCRPAVRPVAWRTAAALALVAFVLGPLAPLALAFADEGGATCCRGRCCCSGAKPSPDTCVRAACHCGGEPHTVLPASPHTEAVLPRPDELPPAAPVSTLAPEPAARLTAPARLVPDPPPWFLLPRLSAA
jgi:hypothetical protein